VWVVWENSIIAGPRTRCSDGALIVCSHCQLHYGVDNVALVLLQGGDRLGLSKDDVGVRGGRLEDVRLRNDEENLHGSGVNKAHTRAKALLDSTEAASGAM